MRSSLRSGVVALAVGLAAWATAPAQAAPLSETYSFVNITNNNATDAAIGEAQLFVDVMNFNPFAGDAELTGQVLFRFRNTGPAASAISEIYFDDGTLLGIAQIFNGTGVNFTQGASPPDLPGGDSIDPAFSVTAGFLAEATVPPPMRGVGPGETVGILFDLIAGQTYEDVLNALALGSALGAGDNPTGTLRIGIHVIGFAGGGSESFINNGNGTGKIPEPASLALLGVGLLGLGMIAWRRRTDPLAG